MRRLAEADIVGRPHRRLLHGLPWPDIVSTMDFVYRESTLGGDLARRQVNDL